MILRKTAFLTSPTLKYQTARIRRSLIAVVALVILLSPHYGWGAGLELYETGAPDLGTASAGRAAMASDASTTASNSAGMTLLDRTQLLGAAGALLPSTNFDVASQTTTKGGGGGNAGVFTPLGSFFFVYKLTDQIRLGVATYSDYGLSGDYGKKWVGRFYLTEVSLISSRVSPEIAYSINEWLSVGAGFSFGVGRLGFQSKINNALPRVPDGGLSMESWDEAFGGNVGFLLRPVKKLRLGFIYQSPEDYKFGFRPHVTGLGPVTNAIRNRIGGTKVNIPLTEPQRITASALYEVTPRLSVMGNVGWQNWSAFGEFPVGISAINQRSVTANLNFSDTCSIAIGQQFQIAEGWLWSAGFAYDSSPVSKTNRIPVLPIDRQLRYGTGIQYEVNQNVTAGVAAELLDAGPGPYSGRRGPLAGTLQGHLLTNYLNFVAANVIWKF